MTATFLTDDDGLKVAYAELDDRARQISGWAPTGALVGIRMPTLSDTATAIAACWLAGRTFTVYPFSHRPDLELTRWPRAAEAPVPDRVDQESVYALLSTSGTTGMPKRIPLKRRQMISAAAASTHLKPDPNQAWLLSIPLNHIGGIAVVLRSVLFGTRIHIGEPGAALRHGTGVQVASLVSTQLHRLLADPGFRIHEHFRAILLGGGRLPAALIAQCRNRNIPVIPSFGMTETNAQIIAVPFPEWKSAPVDTCGKVIHPNEARIEDGILRLRGPQLADPTTWFDTGDHATIDADGWVRIQSRRTDRIVTGGENVDPEAVEEALLAECGFEQAAVVGLPDDEWGQIVVAVVGGGARMELTEIRTRLRDVLPPFALPKSIEWWPEPELPRTANGKLRRAEIRDRLIRPV